MAQENEILLFEKTNKHELYLYRKRWMKEHTHTKRPERNNRCQVPRNTQAVTRKRLRLAQSPLHASSFHRFVVKQEICIDIGHAIYKRDNKNPHFRLNE